MQIEKPSRIGLRVSNKYFFPTNLLPKLNFCQNRLSKNTYLKTFSLQAKFFIVFVWRVTNFENYSASESLLLERDLLRRRQLQHGDARRNPHHKVRIRLCRIFCSFNFSHFWITKFFDILLNNITSTRVVGVGI